MYNKQKIRRFNLRNRSLWINIILRFSQNVISNITSFQDLCYSILF